MYDNYTIVVHGSSSSRTFFAYSPEIDGCIADGNSFLEAIDNFQFLVEEWMLLNDHQMSPLSMQPHALCA